MKGKDLAQLRNEIDVVDRAIIAALSKRKKLEKAVGAFKRARGMKPLDVKRRNAVLKTRVAAGVAKGVQAELLRKLFKLIHHYSLSVQKKLP